MPSLRDAQVRDLPAIRTVLARAYHPNPLITWVFPDEDTRDDSCAAWLGPSLERYLTSGAVHVVEDDGEVVAAAAWWPAGVPRAASATRSGTTGTTVAAGRGDTLPSSAGVLAALVGPQRAHKVRTALGSSAPLFPSGPSAYLNYLAVAPERQREGFGAALVRHGLRLLTEAGHGAHLGTTDPGNVGFYTALGFRSVGAVPLDVPGPLLEILVRPAGPRAGQTPATTEPDPGAGSA